MSATVESVIDTPRLRLVMPAARHVAAHAAWCASDRAAAFGWRLPADRAWREFASILGHHGLRGYGPFVAEDRESGRSLGIFGAWFPDGLPFPEIKWTLWDEGAVGRGLAHEAAAATIAHIRDTPGWDRPVSCIAPDNARSARLAARLGAVREGDRVSSAGNVLDIWRHGTETTT